MIVDELLDTVRKRMSVVVSDPTDANSGLDLAEAFRVLDEVILSGSPLPKDWEVGKKFAWRNGKGGSMVLDFNGQAVGHVIPRGDAHPGGALSPDEWMYNASLKPTPELPYMVASKFEDDAGTLEEAMAECEAYVREQTKTLFNPWRVLKDECLI